MVRHIVLILQICCQFGQANLIFGDDALHEFTVRLWEASFRGLEEVECVFDCQLGNLQLGILQNGQWSSDRIGNRGFGINKFFSGFRQVLTNFSGCFFERLRGR